ncbi:protein phosphatase 1 regulatory subunit 21 [Erinaceus europaeus]|uniref:Protein phosphatase 1 regulatory subunit 21 n=1 Tax=Erinaceus europaeus TaxID=9365 RepID=A0ABM3X6I3_ERIEU|nr:protein phosphatase 1 regulatory subunit 21 [Erinaceus europaeus]
MASAELQGKYQKLAQEYSKLRAQNQVLKKGVVDEQANSASLKEQLKMKDQSLRKLQQEMDSLTFRNLQLAKRVELLQDELALSEPRGKKNKKSGESSQLSQEQKSVFDEDLQKKIEENERLHIQFFEADEQHKHVEAELRSRLTALETEAAQHQAVVDGLTRKYMETIEKLQNDKAKLEVKSQTLEKEAKECRLRTEECQLQLKNLHEDLSGRLEESLSIINEKVPFNDTKYNKYNALNVPLHNRKHQLKMRDLAGQALAFVQDLVTALLNFHTYTEQRIQIFPVDSAIDTISPLNQKVTFNQNTCFNRLFLSLILMMFFPQPLLESVPYEEALANRRVLLSSTESREGLAQQVQQNLEKISKLEQEKEHWMLEAQLAKIKLEKENQRIADKLKYTSSGQVVGMTQESTTVVNASNQEETSGKTESESVQSSSLIGILTKTSENEVLDVESREDLIKNHYMARIVELTSQLQLADSKSVHFYAECRALSKRLALAEKSKEALTEEMKVASQNISRLQDELTTTKRSYEDQLSMMSDHLCSMNETLSKQREEIDTLKMSSKGNSKKNKNR